MLDTSRCRLAVKASFPATAFGKSWRTQTARSQPGKVDLRESTLAKKARIHVTSLYKPRFKDLISEVERICEIADRVSREQACRNLEIRLDKLIALDRIERPSSKIPHNASAQMGLPFSGRTGIAAPWPIISVRPSRSGGTSLESAIVNLWSAIFIVIDAFMADRLLEVLDTEVDCLTIGSDGYYLDVLNDKRQQHIARAQRRPTLSRHSREGGRGCEKARCPFEKFFQRQ